MTRAHKSNQIYRRANRKAAFYLLWFILCALGLTVPTQSQAPEPTLQSQEQEPYTNAQKDAYYTSLLKDRQDSQSALQSRLQDYRTYPLLDLAYRLLAEGRPEDALKELDELLASHPNHLIARWQKIQTLVALDRPDAAIEQLNILQSQAPAFSRGYLSLGYLYTLKGSYQLAFDSFRRALETGKLLQSDRANALAGSAEAAIKLGNTEEALNTLNSLYDLGVATPQQRLARADLLRNSNQVEEAQREWVALSQLDSAPETQRTATLNEAFFLMEQGEDEEAYQLLLTAERNGMFSGRQSTALEQRTFARALAASALTSGHLDELLAFLSTGRIDLLGLSSRVQLAYVLAKKGSSAEAEKALLTSDGKILETKASSPEEAANYYLALVDIALRAGDDARAATASRLLIEMTRSPEYVLQLSMLAQNNGWQSAAISSLVQLRAITEPSEREKAPEAWAKLLQELSELSQRAGDLAFADEVLKEAEALTPSWRITAKRGALALLSDNTSLASALLHDAHARAKLARSTEVFSETDKEAYAYLLFDLAALSADKKDWNTALEYLIADWTLQPDPSLVLPAYLILQESTATNTTARQWLDYVTDYTKSADLSEDERKKFASAFLSLARTQKAEGELEEADKSYIQTVRLDPIPEAVLESAYLALQLDDPSRALGLVETMDQTKHPDAIMAIRCQAYRVLGRDIDDLSCPEPEESAQPSGAEGYLILGNLYLQQDEKDKAKQALLKSYELGPSLAVSNQLGFLYQEEGDKQAAQHWFTRSFEQHNDQTAGMALLYINLQQMEYDKAGRLISRLDPSTMTREQMAGYYASRAQITLYQGEQSPEALEKALVDLRKARSIETNPDIRFSVVQVLFQQGKLEEAEAEYLALPEADKTSSVTLALGGYLARTRGDYDLAITRFEASLEADPDQEDLQEDLAYTYLAAFENKKAAKMFRKRIDVLYEQQLDIFEQDKLQRFQRQLRILEIPLSLLIVDAASPSRQDEETTTGAILGIPSSSPFGAVEVAWRPPVFGYQNGRVFEFIARSQWLNERYSFRPDPDTYQTIVGVRFKPFMSQNFKLGLERFFKGGSITEDNWLGRVLWSFNRGHDFLPLYDLHTGLPIKKEPYISLYLEGGRFFEKEKTVLLYGDGRLGYTFRLDPNLIFSPYTYSIGSGNLNSRIKAVAIEAGLGASLKWRGLHTKSYGDLLSLEVFARVGHEVLNTNDSKTSRVLIGLQANF